MLSPAQEDLAHVKNASFLSLVLLYFSMISLAPLFSMNSAGCMVLLQLSLSSLGFFWSNGASKKNSIFFFVFSLQVLHTKGSSSIIRLLYTARSTMYIPCLINESRDLKVFRRYIRKKKKKKKKKQHADGIAACSSFALNLFLLSLYLILVLISLNQSV